MSSLFDPLKLRGLTLRNRIVMPPMCQYRCENDGLPTAWHLVHYGARAVGGTGLLIVEATGVLPEGRISPADCGLWNDAQVEAFKPITAFIKENGAAAGIQLAHAGRKAATKPSREGDGPLEANDPRNWKIVAPSALPFAPNFQTPRAMTISEIEVVVEAFAAATRRAIKAGFNLIEIHSAHGYLLHEFLSPLTNKREDEFGGSLENRMRFPLAVARAVRAATPVETPVIVRVSATDWAEGGWDLPQTIAYAKELKALGIDLIDVSTGGLLPDAKIPVAPNYQVSFAKAVRKELQMPVATVGLITDAKQAQEIVERDEVDAVGIGRALLADPHWPLRAAHELGTTIEWPQPYLRGRWR